MATLRQLKRRSRQIPPTLSHARREPVGGRFAMPASIWNELATLSDSRDARALSLLNGPAAPPQGADLGHPWWATVCSTVPALLSMSERASSELLVGWTAPGQPPPDWNAVALRAARIFDAQAARAGSQAQLNLLEGVGRDDPNSPPDASASSCILERLHFFMPSFGFGPDMDAFFESLHPSFCAAKPTPFDPRRAKRRRLKPVPTSWSAPLGAGAAQRLWSSGAHAQTAANALGAPVGGLPPLSKACFDSWGAALASLAQAMLEAGAARVERVPHFFERFPEALGDPRRMAHIDQLRQDPLRANWDLREAAGMSSLPSKRVSL
jgi:hypothetical protein